MSKEEVETTDSNNNNAQVLQPLNWKLSDIVWYRLFFTIFGNLLHLPYVVYFLIYGKYSSYTIIFNIVSFVISGVAVTAGFHRMWSHRAYKAKLPLQIIWMITSTTAAQGDGIYWSLQHRMHHKFAETEADPHDARRGFFYSHVGWLLVKEKEEFKRKFHLIDMSDLESNPVLKFQEKYLIPLTLMLAILFPLYLPTVLWHETWWASANILYLKFTILFHCTLSVNSFAHLYGTKPYDKNIGAVESRMATFCSSGEGFHNYHHTFPQDYRASELTPFRYNFATVVIDFFAMIGWAYDLKSTPSHVVHKRKQRTGSKGID